MYHCHTRFFLAGNLCRTFEMIKEMPPLEHFAHEFFEDGKPEGEYISKADVIIANLQDMDVKKMMQDLAEHKRKETELILLADRAQIPLLAEYLSKAEDIWTVPMSDEEIRFRFLRWQESCKTKKDFWETSQYLESTINYVPNLIWYKDKNGIHEKVNDSFCKTVNKTKEQVQGRGHAYIWDVEHDDPACIESEREVMSSEKTCVSEEVVQAGEGTRLLTTYKSPLYDLDGTVMGTVGVAIDVTQERAYEQEIMRKNRTLELIFKTMECGVMCHSRDGHRIISINKAALDILGYSSQEEMMRDGFDMVATSVIRGDREKLRDSIRELKKEGDSVSVEYRVRHKNGDIRHVMGNVKMIQENGELLYQRFLLDCTARKLREEEEKKRQAELLHALSIDYRFVCFYNLDTGRGIPLRSDNNGMFGSSFRKNMTLQKSLELYIKNYVYDEDREMFLESVCEERLKEELGRKSQYYVNYRTFQNGKTEYYQLKAVRAGEWDENRGIVLGFRSVDEEIRREMEKKSLLEDALSQANKANNAKSAFLSNMSHDIRTPMNAIVGFTDLAITRIGNQSQVESYLEKIRTSGNHLLNLINDVLDMSRIESGKLHLEEKPCCLSDIIDELYNILQADAHAKQLELTFDAGNVFDEEIYCDTLRLKQVLLNLLSNAVKYTGAGGSVSMCVTESSGMQDGYRNYEFCIKDTGIGMSKQFLSRIFEPFEREKNSTISGIQGTGLGMAITKNIIDMMGGFIEVESEQGIGTEVTVSFSFRLSNIAPDKVRDIGRDIKKFRGGRILLAEDNELNQEIAVAILEDAGFSVDVAENGQIAVDMLKCSEPGHYQLILMDVQMPVMNGHEATREIRRLRNMELASIPILAMTANAFEEDRQEALRCGMNGHIAKPIDVSSLFETLNRVLG